MTCTGLTIGKKYLFTISQNYHPAENVWGINDCYGLTVDSKYQSNIAVSVSGAPGYVIGTATSNSVTINFPRHNGGISITWFEL